MLSLCRQFRNGETLLSGLLFFRCYMMQSLLPVLCSIIILSLNSSIAYAYLDPGAISLALQAITAAVAGAVLTGKYWFWWLLDFLGIKKRSKESDNLNTTSPGDE